MGWISSGKILVNSATHVKMNTMEKQNSRFNSAFQNSASFQRHKKQQFWQILTPVGVGLLMTLVIVALVIRAALLTDAGGPVSQWADISLIWLLMPVMLFAILATLILIGLIYLVARLLKILPTYTFLVQYYTTLISTQVRQWTDKLVRPIISFESIKASVGAFFSALSGPSDHR